MLMLLKALALKLLAGRSIGGAFSLLLFVLAPVAAVLKFIGIPVLLVVGLIGAPVFALLAAIGLPALLVVGIGVVMMLAVGVLITVGMLLLKIALPIILVVLFVRWLRRPRSAQPPAAPTADPGLDGI
jgi:hypothetical protein